MSDCPNPIWRDEVSGMTVWLNGALIEIDCSGDFTRVTADEAAPLPAAFALAINEARAWASRWDGRARTYVDEPS